MQYSILRGTRYCMFHIAGKVGVPAVDRRRACAGSTTHHFFMRGGVIPCSVTVETAVVSSWVERPCLLYPVATSGRAMQPGSAATEGPGYDCPLGRRQGNLWTQHTPGCPEWVPRGTRRHPTRIKFIRTTHPALFRVVKRRCFTTRWASRPRLPCAG